jgi:hypothetical protein
MRRHTLLLLSAPTVVVAIDPRYAQNITVFHINPREEGPIPLNMDTGDALGDLFFDMMEVICVHVCVLRGGGEWGMKVMCCVGAGGWRGRGRGDMNGGSEVDWEWRGATRFSGCCDGALSTGR